MAAERVDEMRSGLGEPPTHSGNAPGSIWKWGLNTRMNEGGFCSMNVEQRQNLPFFSSSG